MPVSGLRDSPSVARKTPRTDSTLPYPVIVPGRGFPPGLFIPFDVHEKFVVSVFLGCCRDVGDGSGSAGGRRFRIP